MESEAEIIANAKATHDELTAHYYAGVSDLTKEQFEELHGSIWNKLEADLILAGYKKPQVLSRDLAAELDSLAAEISALFDSLLFRIKKLEL